MKHYFFLAFSLVFYFSGFSQKDSIVSSYEGVVQIDSLTANKLFAQAKMASRGKLFDRFQILDKLEDEANNVIVYKIRYRSAFALVKSGTIRFTFTLQFKDGKYKYRIDNMQYFEEGLSKEVGLPIEKNIEGKSLQKNWDFVQQANAANMNGFLKDFNTQMKEASSW